MQLPVAAMFGMASLLAALPARAAPRSADASPSFTEEVVDESNAGDCKAVADIDEDGLVDGVIGGAELAWYRYPDWKKTVIANAEKEFTTDCQSVDVDADGHVDIVVPDGPDSRNVVWFRNPGPDSGARWTRTPIGSYGTWAHDVEVGDIDGDRHVDVVTRSKDGPVILWLQVTPSDWSKSVISDRSGEGTAVADVDDDGDLDVLIGGFWLENRDAAGTAWAEHQLADMNSASIFVADIDGDDRSDVFIGPNEAEGPVVWYRSARGKPRTITKDSGGMYHTFKAADMNGDGEVDLATAAMFGKVTVWLNIGGGKSWKRHVVSSDAGLHNLRLGDFGDDGDIDIFGSNYLGNPPVYLLVNNTATPKS
jgi:hypothetical protein